MKSAAPNRRVARCHALIPCAGSGSRAGAGQPKQYQPIGGAPLVWHTLAAFADVPRIAQTLIVTAPGDDALAARLPGGLPHDAFALADCGGASRAESVFNGLERLLQRGAAGSDWVLVHDAARCLITPALINRLIDACLNAASADEEGGLSGALLAMPLPGTLKAADAAPRAAAPVRAAAPAKNQRDGSRWQPPAAGARQRPQHQSHLAGRFRPGRRPFANPP